MGRENVEVVRLLYEGWTRGDFRGTEFFDPNVEFEIDASVSMAGRVEVQGIAEMGKTWREVLSGWGDFRVGEILRLVETEDGVIALNRLQGRGRRSGIVVDQPDRAAVFTFRDGLITRLRLMTATDALEAAGLRE